MTSAGIAYDTPIIGCSAEDTRALRDRVDATVRELNGGAGCSLNQLLSALPTMDPGVVTGMLLRLRAGGKVNFDQNTRTIKPL